MTETSTETRTVVIEREIGFPPERLWRALTQPHLIGEWLMKTDFQPVVGQGFSLRGEWGTVDCTLLAIEPNRLLSYSWDAMGLESIVTYMLTPTSAGTHLRIEQAGFRPDQDRAHAGARFGWAQFLGKLESLLGRMDEGEPGAGSS